MSVIESIMNEIRGHKLQLKDELGQVRITVISKKSNQSHSQVLPYDHLEDRNVIECIRFCRTRVIDKEK